jgi:hypothetical protein
MPGRPARRIPHQLRVSGSVAAVDATRSRLEILPWADMFGGGDVMIGGRIGDKEVARQRARFSPCSRQVRLWFKAPLRLPTPSPAITRGQRERSKGSPEVASIKHKFRLSPKGLQEHSETSSRRGFNVADAVLEGPRPSVVSATPGRKLSLGVFKMPLRGCLSELAS